MDIDESISASTRKRISEFRNEILEEEERYLELIEKHRDTLPILQLFHSDFYQGQATPEKVAYVKAFLDDFHQRQYDTLEQYGEQPQLVDLLKETLHELEKDGYRSFVKIMEIICIQFVFNPYLFLSISSIPTDEEIEQFRKECSQQLSLFIHGRYALHISDQTGLGILYFNFFLEQISCGSRICVHVFAFYVCSGSTRFDCILSASFILFEIC